MTEGSLERQVGRLTGLVESLARTVEQQGESSSDARARLYDGQEKMRLDMQAMASRMETVEKTVSAMEPLVGEFGKVKERWRGVLIVGGLLWLLLGGLAISAVHWAASWVWRALTGA